MQDGMDYFINTCHDIKKNIKQKGSKNDKLILLKLSIILLIKIQNTKILEKHFAFIC